MISINSFPNFNNESRYANSDNLQFDDENAVLFDVNLFKKHGGGTIVENTTHGIKRNAGFLKDLSLKTGVHIVAGTGNNNNHGLIKFMLNFF